MDRLVLADPAEHLSGAGRGSDAEGVTTVHIHSICDLPVKGLGVRSCMVQVSVEPLRGFLRRLWRSKP